MSPEHQPIVQQYARALAQAFARSAGADTDPADVEALAAFLADRFDRAARRLPPEGRDEFLSAVALEFLDRAGRPDGPRSRTTAELEDAFQRATITVLDTIRHRMARALRAAREAEVPHPTTDGPAGDVLLRRELATRLSPEAMAVLYLVMQGQPVDDIAAQLDVSQRTIYRALRAIRTSLDAGRRDGGA